MSLNVSEKGFESFAKNYTRELLVLELELAIQKVKYTKEDVSIGIASHRVVVDFNDKFVSVYA